MDLDLNFTLSHTSFTALKILHNLYKPYNTYLIGLLRELNDLLYVPLSAVLGKNWLL